MESVEGRQAGAAILRDFPQKGSVDVVFTVNDGGGLDGWNNVGEIRNVTAELLTRGYSETDIAKLWAGNFLRVWEQVQKAAHPVANR